MSADLATHIEPDALDGPAADRDRTPKSVPFGRDPAPVRWTLRLIAVVYVFMLVAWPTYLVFERALAPGLGTALDSLRDPEVGHALYLTVYITVIAVLINLVFGLTMSILLVRYDFWGKRVLSTLLDVPLSISPVVVGLALVLVYNGRDGWFGPGLEGAGFQVIFASPGMVMATVFVALPLVIREVVPVLEEIGDDQEQAARSLGANWGQTFRRITLPAIKWAVVYGVVLALARSHRRVRRGQDRLGQHRRPDQDRGPAGRGHLPELPAGHGLRPRRPARLHRDDLPRHRRRPRVPKRAERPHEHQRQGRQQEVR